MMETFIVLGLCFILYEALDFFQGCMHNSSPSTTDQIDAYRRQLDEQRQQQQQEQFLANLSPLLGAQLATLSSTSTINTASSSTTSATPTASTASVISDLHRQQEIQLQQQQPTKVDNYSVSTPALNAAFRPAHRSVYESQNLHGTSSLPRDYYYVQQQQLKNKHSAKSLLSKLSSSSDNRIFPESAGGVLGAPAGVITTQPSLGANSTSYDYTAAVAAQPTSLAFDLKRAILSSNSSDKECKSKTISSTGDGSCTDRNNESTEQQTQRRPIGISTLLEEQNNSRNLKHCSKHSINSIGTTDSGDEVDGDDEEDDDDEGDVDSASSSNASISSKSASAGSASLASCGYSSDQEAADEREFAAGSCSSSHADFREIECERLRRKCVSVKRIYSISEKF